jgi:hypothetical protein
LLVLVLVGIAGLVVLEKVSDHRQRAAAEAALPEARAFLAGNPAYKGLQVNVADTQDQGWCLWFTGSLPTDAEVVQFDEELEKRYAGTDVEFACTVLSRK